MSDPATPPSDVQRRLCASIQYSITETPNSLTTQISTIASDIAVMKFQNEHIIATLAVIGRPQDNENVTRGEYGSDKHLGDRMARRENVELFGGEEERGGEEEGGGEKEGGAPLRGGEEEGGAPLRGEEKDNTAFLAGNPREHVPAVALPNWAASILNENCSRITRIENVLYENSSRITQIEDVQDYQEKRIAALERLQ